ncbi:MAG: hypothetical protein WD512_15980, partial [Candidatus Paceibacterota bacterium]
MNLKDDKLIFEFKSPNIAHPSEILEFKNELVFWSSRVADIIKYYHNIIDSEQINQLLHLITQINLVKSTFSNPPNLTQPPKQQLDRTTFSTTRKRISFHNLLPAAPTYPAPQIETEPPTKSTQTEEIIEITPTQNNTDNNKDNKDNKDKYDNKDKEYDKKDKKKDKNGKKDKNDKKNKKKDKYNNKEEEQNVKKPKDQKD